MFLLANFMRGLGLWGNMLPLFVTQPGSERGMVR